MIFDCDGVLVDSEPIANRVLAEQLGLHGFTLTPEEVMRRFVGNSRDNCISMAGAMRGRPLHAGFAREWDEAFHVALAREVRPVDGVPEVLRSLPVPYCVASNAYAGGPQTDHAEVAALGATVFTHMRELPRLLELA